MSQQLRTDPESQDVVQYVEQITNMTLAGAPRFFVLDAAAIWGPTGDALAEAILRKLGLLAQQDQGWVVVYGADDRQVTALRAALPNERLVTTPGAGPADLPRLLAEYDIPASDVFAVLAVPGAQVPDGSTVFHVGQGEAPAHAHPTALPGAHGTDSILALYGTALAQERAGIGFRRLSAGQGIPSKAPFTGEPLQAVVRAAERPAAPTPTAWAPLPDDGALRALAARAYARLLPNILPTGVIVGSPAKGTEPGQPNYWFYWQRDGSITMGHLIDWYRRPPLGLDTSGLGAFIERYPDFVAETQRNGPLGTSRYTIEGRPILGFGNPQLDGPPLSALALARLPDPARGWDQLRRFLEFLLTPDGRAHSMDIWEFIYGRLFNAEFLKRRALLVGAEVATRLGHQEDALRYTAEARRVASGLEDYIDWKLGRLAAYREPHNPWFQTISRLDMSIIVAVLSGWRLRWDGAEAADGHGDSVGLGNALDSLAHPAVLATMQALEDAYASYFKVNRDWTAGGNAGYGLGRFPEDSNDGVGSSGGNPWPLATLWAAQLYYHLAQELTAALKDSGASLVLDDPRQVAFLKRVYGNGVERGRPINVTMWRDRLLPALVAHGDGYLNFVVHHIPEDGGVTEQIDGDTGRPRGARDLSWALSELIATIALREDVQQIL